MMHLEFNAMPQKKKKKKKKNESVKKNHVKGHKKHH